MWIDCEADQLLCFRESDNLPGDHTSTRIAGIENLFIGIQNRCRRRVGKTATEAQTTAYIGSQLQRFEWVLFRLDAYDRAIGKRVFIDDTTLPGFQVYGRMPLPPRLGRRMALDIVFVSRPPGTQIFAERLTVFF